MDEHPAGESVPDQDDELDKALDVLYDEIASLDCSQDCHLVLTSAEFEVLLAAMDLLRQHLTPEYEERQLALDYLHELLLDARTARLEEQGRGLTA